MIGPCPRSVWFRGMSPEDVRGARVLGRETFVEVWVRPGLGFSMVDISNGGKACLKQGNRSPVLRAASVGNEPVVKSLHLPYQWSQIFQRQPKNKAASQPLLAGGNR